jgi:hypothetical protein
MPPRYAYWTIIAGGLPTAFRAAEREELLPTFQRIRQKHPDAEMKYFARGKLWESREAAHADEKRPSTRNRDWRPGGDHRDPRQKFVDAKRQRNAATRQQRWERKNTPPRERAHGDALRDRPRHQKPQPRKPWIRAQGTEEPAQPPRPRDPNREPKPSENPQPSPPPREEPPTVPSPAPPERGSPRRRFQTRGRFPKGPRR